MRAVIVAAARSPRLLPLTKRTPVSLLEVGGQAILGHQLEALGEAGVEDTLVITGFCADQVESFCRGKATCLFNPFYEMCNVAMNLWLVRQELRPGFLLLYNDTLFRAELMRQVLARDDGIVLVCDQRGVDKEAEKIALEEGVVSAIGKSVLQPFGEFVGMARFSMDTVPALVEALDQVARTDLGTSFPQLVQRLVGQGQVVRAHVTDLPWRDIDFPADLEEANRTWVWT